MTGSKILTDVEKRQKAEEAAKFFLIEGDVTLTNEADGAHKTFRFAPFYVPKDTPWVDIVDQAVEAATPAEGSWIHMGEENINERACPGCVSQILNGGFGPSHRVSGYCQSGKRPHCTCDMCF